MQNKKNIKIVLLFIPVLFAFIGCGTHINKIGKFEIENKNILYKHYVNPDLTRVNVDIGEYYYDQSLVTVVLTDIGGTIAENNVKEKVLKAINADSIVIAISKSISEEMRMFFNTKTVKEVDENPHFIVETKLERFRIVSNSSGIFAMIDTRIVMIDRKTAKTVWENTECANVPIGDVIYDFNTNRYIKTAKGVINTVRLLQMSEEEIKASINIAVKEAGKRQCEQLREDIANKD